MRTSTIQPHCNGNAQLAEDAAESEKVAGFNGSAPSRPAESEVDEMETMLTSSTHDVVPTFSKGATTASPTASQKVAATTTRKTTAATKPKRTTRITRPTIVVPTALKKTTPKTVKTSLRTTKTTTKRTTKTTTTATTRTTTTKKTTTEKTTTKKATTKMATTKKATTKKATTKKPTTEKATTRRTTTKRTTSTTTTTTTPKPPINEQPLFCSAGAYATASQMYPPDGLCEVVFYTHIYFRDEQAVSSSDFRSYDKFAAVAKQGGKATKFGVSLDARYAATIDLEGYSGKNSIQRLWDGNIRHFGILNIDGRGDDFAGYPRVPRLFQRLNELVESIARGDIKNRTYFVLGAKLMAYDKPTDREQYVNYIRIWSTLQINALIINTAVNTWKEGESCRSYLPTMWETVHPGSQPSFVMAIEMIQKAALAADDAVVLLSFTMGIPIYRMVERYKGRSQVGLDCETVSMVQYTQLCEPDTKEYFEDGRKRVALAEAYMASFSDYSYTWDEIDTITLKMNKTVQKYPRKRLGFMLFDVEFEDGIPTCHDQKLGTFPRVRAARKFLDSYAKQIAG